MQAPVRVGLLIVEYLDIVDESDRVVGRASRAEIHQRGHIHRASHMLLFNSDGELFLQQRSLHKDSGGGQWDSSAAGHVDSGETYLACAVRELEEELGLQVAATDLIEQFKLPPRPETGMEFATVYTLVSDQPLVLDPDEIIDGRWLSPAAVTDWIARSPLALTSGFVEIWRRLCERDNPSR